jgi:hypothetical protein
MMFSYAKGQPFDEPVKTRKKPFHGFIDFIFLEWFPIGTSLPRFGHGKPWSIH